MDGKNCIGRVDENSDGSFTGRIRGFSASGSSWEDAFNAVVAAVEGIAVSELTDALISIKKSQQHTQTILNWLINNAEANDGQLCFTNRSGSCHRLAARQSGARSTDIAS
jgi:hypothetical protein